VRRLLLWIPACAWMAVIFYASSVPGDEITIHVWDKLLHLGVYSVLGICFLLATANGRRSQVTVKAAVLAVLLATAYGVTDEFHQNFTPERTPDVMDVLADTLGATVGVTAIGVLRFAYEKGATRWLQRTS